MPSVDGFDISSWQTGIAWNDITERRFLAIRAFDGGYIDPYFMDNWRQAASMDFRWLFVYGLLSDANPQRQVDQMVSAVMDSGVPWRPGMGYALDIEVTKEHAIASRGTVEWIAERLNARLARPAPLIYSYWSGYVRDMARENHWPLWLALPANEWDAQAAAAAPVVWQWGTAGPGEQNGFPVTNVDVNQTIGEDLLDALTGRIDIPTKDGFTMADLDTIQQMFNRGIDDLAALEARLDKAAADRDAAITAHIDQLKALVEQINAHSGTIAGQIDPKAFMQGVVRVLAAGVDATR